LSEGNEKQGNVMKRKRKYNEKEKVDWKSSGAT